MVRILLPPAKSPLRTCFARLGASYLAQSPGPSSFSRCRRNSPAICRLYAAPRRAKLSTVKAGSSERVAACRRNNRLPIE
jgi:hypothetical protein